MKKKKEVYFRHYILTRLIAPFVRFFIKRAYKLQLKNYKALKGKGPFVVLGNHTINVDPLIMGLHFPFHLYYIATEQVFNLGFLSTLIKYIVNPIKKSKSISDLETIRKTRRIVEQGGSIGIFPEGNTTLNGITSTIQPATVKLIKMLKLPVIILNTEGLYLSFPRWSIYRKKGKTKSYIKKILLPETYLDWDEDQLYEAIKALLYVDAYKDQKVSQILYKGKHMAAGLEKLIFMDLNTNKPFVTYSHKNMLKSKNSDFSLTYLPNGKVMDQNGLEHTLYDMDQMVKESYFKFYNSTNLVILFEEDGIVYKTNDQSKTKLGKFKLILSKHQITIKNNDISNIYHFDDVINIAMQGKYQIILYLSHETYLIRLDKYSSLYKYILTYQYYKYVKQKGQIEYDNNYNFGI